MAGTPKIDFSPNSAVQNVSPELDATGSLAERKTNSNPAEPTIASSNATNVLAGLRSYTYNFTIACLSPDQIGNPGSYSSGSLDKVVLSSSGKKSSMTAGDTSNIPQQDQSATTNLLGSFNKTSPNSPGSPGRFNLFMDNLEINSLVSFTELANATQPTTFTFDVYEPYSVNGFLQALSVAAITGGWNSYSEGAFVLLIEFLGYPDGPGTPDPVTIGEKRYIPFKFTNSSIEITEKGTHYKCSAVSWNEIGFGHSGRLKSPVTAHGTTLDEILNDLMDTINKQLDEECEKQNGKANAKKHDTFKIRIDDADISKAKVIDIDKNITSFAFIDPQQVPGNNQNYPTGDKTKKSVYNANNTSNHNIQFNSNENLYEIISNLVVTSEYIRKVIKNLTENNGSGAWSNQSAGMIKYFSIKIETKETGRDAVHNLAIREYTYVISKFEVHYTRIPDYSKYNIDLSALQTVSVRTYKYIYTGENREVLAFRMNYDHLFYEGMPRAYAIDEQPTSESRSSPTNDTIPEQSGNAPPKSTALGVASNAVRTDPSAERYNKLNNGILRQDDPYFALAYNLHKAVIKPQASLARAELEILGDPFYLVTGGIGNQPNAADEMAARSGDCIIDIQFRNPEDIGTDGFMAYNQSVNDPFHGAYRVVSITHHFRDGLFKQRLDLIRVPGQDSTNSSGGDPGSQITTVGAPNPEGNTTQDTRDSTDVSTPGGGNLSALTGIGFPTPGSNFPNVVGGLGLLLASQTLGASDQPNIGLSSNNLGGNSLAPVSVNINAVSTPQSNVNAALGIPNSPLSQYIYNPTTQLSGLSGGSVTGGTEAAINSSLAVGPNVNLAQAVSDGVSFKYLPNLDIPATQPRALAALQAPLSADDLKVVAQGGLPALAKTQGVSVSELSSPIQSQVAGLTNSAVSPLTKLNNALKTG